MELVAPREGRVSRNTIGLGECFRTVVAPREGRVSRNVPNPVTLIPFRVAPREGRVSRNDNPVGCACVLLGRAPRGACE